MALKMKREKIYTLCLLLFIFSFTLLEKSSPEELKAVFLGCFLGGLFFLLSLRHKISYPLFPMVILLLLLTICIFSTSTSPHPYISLLKDLELLAYILSLVLTYSLFKNFKLLKIFIKGLLAIGTIISLWGIGDYLRQDPQTPIGHLLRNPLGWHTTMAAYLNLILPLSLSSLLYPGFSFFNFFSTFVMIDALILTYSRAGWLAFTIGLLFLLIFWPRKKTLLKKWPVFLCLILLVVLTLLPLQSSYGGGKTTMKSLSPKVSVTNLQRINLYKQSLVIIKDFPLLGSGPGTFADVFRKYQNQPWLYSSLAHNQFLEYGVEMGIIGLTFFLIFLIFLATKFIKNLSYIKKEGEKGIFLLGIGASLTALLSHNLFNSDLSIPIIALLFWSEAGAFLALMKEKGSKELKLLPLLTGLSIFSLFFSALLAQNFFQFKKIQKMARQKTNDQEFKKEATARLEKMVKIFPNEQYLVWAAAFYYDLNQKDLALQKLGKAKKLSRFDPVFSFRMGEIELGRRNFLKAASYLEEAIIFNPYTSPKYHLSLAKALLAQNKKEEARTVLSQALKKYFPKNDSFYSYKYLYDFFGDTKTLETIEKILENLNKD